jgi:hypothetical protein
MNIFNWWRSLWHRDAVNKATATAKVLVDGLSTDQFNLVVDEVVRASKTDLPGIEKAKAVRDAITNPNLVAAYKLPPWVNQGIDLASTIVQLAWVVAKVLKRIK